MAKRKQAAKSTELDGPEFFAAIEEIEREKGIPQAYMIDKITQALVAAYKKDHEGVTDNVFVETDREHCRVRMFVKKEVVETVDNPYTEMSLRDAKAALPRAALGDMLRVEIKPRNFGRIAAQTARQVIIQGMREAEGSMVFDEFSSKEHEILTGKVIRVDARTGAAVVRINGGGTYVDAFLSTGEQLKDENIREDDHLRVYVVEVRKASRGPQVLISRTHPGLVKRLFELEVPEIYDGSVTIMSVAREAGSRTKLAVYSSDENVDPIGACVGPKGQRINAIIEELRGEKVDVVRYSDDPAQYVAAALAPADVLQVSVSEDKKSCRVVVPDDQLSLAIGKEGQNARLAARLTSFKIDIRPASAPEPEEEAEVTEELEDSAEMEEEILADTEEAASEEETVDESEPEHDTESEEEPAESDGNEVE